MVFGVSTMKLFFSGSRKLICFKIITLFGSVLLVLLVFESFLRWRYRAIDPRPRYLHNPTPRFVAHPFLPYAGRPNDNRTRRSRGEFFGDYSEKVHTNSYGFLGDEFVGEKSRNEIRIVTFGGSTTWCAGVNPLTREGTDEDTWPAILQRKLAARYPNRRFVVYNLAQDAYASPMSVINLAFVGVNLQPDFVIAYDGINDMRFTFDFDMRWDYGDRFQHFDPSQLKSVGMKAPEFAFESYLFCRIVRGLDSLLGYTAYREGIEGVVPPPRPHPFNGSDWNSESLKNIELFLRNQKTMRGICREYRATFVSATLHFYQRDSLRDHFNEELRSFFKKERIPYFDADTRIPKGDLSINTDEVHFSKRGTELMAEGFLATIAPLIEDLSKAK
jgi:lysophospholipase L1-like esterase